MKKITESKIKDIVEQVLKEQNLNETVIDSTWARIEAHIEMVGERGFIDSYIRAEDDQVVIDNLEYMERMLGINWDGTQYTNY